MKRAAVVCLLALLASVAFPQVTDPPITRTNVGRALYPLTSYETGCGATRANTNQYYDVGNLLRYKAVGDGATDIVVQWNRALCSTAFSPDRRKIVVPVGVWRFASKPDDINASIDIQGEQAEASILLADYNEGTTTRGFLQNVSGQGGIGIRKVRIHKGAAVAGGSAVTITSSAATASAWNYIEDVVITTVGGTWNFGMYIDGSAKTTGSAVGVRTMNLRKVSIFAATTECATFISLEAGYLNFSCYPAGGTTGLVRLSGVAAVPSNYMYIDAPFITDLALDRIGSAMIRVGTTVNITDTANVFNTNITAPAIGTDTKLRPAYGLLMPPSKGTGTLSFSTGCTTTPTPSIRWTRNGMTASVSTGDMSCTSNATTSVFTGLPAEITPALTTFFYTACSDNGGARTLCRCYVQNTSSIACDKDIATGAWTASGTKIIIGQTFTYPLN